MNGEPADQKIPVLLVHGVGSHPPDAISSQVEGALSGRAGAVRVEPREYNWNEALQQQSLIRRWGLEEIGRLGVALRNAARIGFDQQPGSRWRRWLEVLWTLPTLLWGIWLLLVLWMVLARFAAATLPTDPPLVIGVPFAWMLVPPIPADLLATTAPLATRLVGWGLPALVAYSILVALLDGATGARRWVVAWRRALLGLAWPVVYALSYTPLIVVVVLLGSVFFFLVGLALDWEQTLGLARSAFDLREAVAAIGRTLLKGVAVILLAGFLVMAVRPAFKVLGDIFLYLGDRNYHEALHRCLLDKLKDLGPAPRLVIAAHSLGSVIVIDSLLDRPRQWEQFGSIELITMGSPLRRLFARFFPSAYPLPDEIAGGLAQRYGAFRWSNIHRRFDYVGGSLSVGGAVADYRVRSGWRLHTGYWSDPAVIGVAERVLGSPPAILEKIAGVAEESAATRIRFRAFRPRELSTPVLLVLVLGGLPAVVWSQYFHVPRAEARAWASWQRALAERGSSVPGMVRSRGARRVQVEWGAGEAARSVLSTGRYPHVDWDALKQALEREPSETLAAEVRAVPGTGMFELPEYRRQPPEFGWWQRLRQTLRAGVLWILWIVCAALVPALIVKSWVGEADPTSRSG